MVRLGQQRILLIGDTERQIAAVVSQAFPDAVVKTVDTVFDGIAELANQPYTTVLAAAEPIERRPDAAVKVLRELAGNGRLLLFGDPSLEPLSQKMLEYGCDDYLITPATPGELLRSISDRSVAAEITEPIDSATMLPSESPASDPEPIQGSDLGLSLFTDEYATANLLLTAAMEDPGDAVGNAVRKINRAMGNRATITILPAIAAPPPNVLRQAPLRVPQPGDNDSPAVTAYLVSSQAATGSTSSPQADGSIEQVFDRVAPLLAKLAALQLRHTRLQRLAITDELTGLYNGRYFRHFLTKIIERAREMRFPVTLFLFDIDNFKKYNDDHGHGYGDVILRQTATLMRRCCRDHDLVARIGGDEFAVIFWEKEGPRQPREPKSGRISRTPNGPQIVLDRFRRLLASQEYPHLGPSGKGCLTISGGLAVYPYDAHDVQALIDAADKQLMLGAKRAGRNCIQLIGGQSLSVQPEKKPKP